MIHKSIPIELLPEAKKVADLLVEYGYCESKSEGKRLIQQGGITIDGRKVRDLNEVLDPNEFSITGTTLQKSRRKAIHFVAPTGDPLWDEKDDNGEFKVDNLIARIAEEEAGNDS